MLTNLKNKSCQEPDRVPIDLGGMGASGITALAYYELKEYLGINEGETRVFDVAQMLAWVEEPVRGFYLQARHCSRLVTLSLATSGCEYPGRSENRYTCYCCSGSGRPGWQVTGRSC